jgi:lipopolysaccharide/colanic/teichoic acid biosynthesis glycosyltransferase
MKPYLVIKRILDFVISLTAIIILLPFFLVIAILIKLDSKGPVFFRQKRAGKDTRIFTVYKFRTMRVETEKDGRLLSDMERMTRVGFFLRKTSIDELPQLFNILKGEMSFIGPRPLPDFYLPYYYEKEIHRHDVKPGISGWAQVNGRNFINWEKRFEYDLFYTNNISFMFDLKIFFLTLKKVFLRSDVGIRGVDFPDKSLHEIRQPNKNTLFYEG